APTTQATDLATLQNHLAASLINMWWEERLAINTATITADNAEKSFTKLADNTYFAPGDPSVLAGPVTRAYGPDANVGGWYSIPFTKAPAACGGSNGCSNGLDRSGLADKHCPPAGTYRFTLTGKAGDISNFDYLCNETLHLTVSGYHRT